MCALSFLAVHVWERRQPVVVLGVANAVHAASARQWAAQALRFRPDCRGYSPEQTLLPVPLPSKASKQASAGACALTLALAAPHEAMAREATAVAAYMVNAKRGMVGDSVHVVVVC